MEFISQCRRQGSEYTYEMISDHNSGSEEGKMIVASVDWMVREGGGLKTPRQDQA